MLRPSELCEVGVSPSTNIWEENLFLGGIGSQTRCVKNLCMSQGFVLVPITIISDPLMWHQFTHTALSFQLRRADVFVDIICSF